MNPHSPKAFLPGKLFLFGLVFLFSATAFSQRIVSLAPGITEIVFALGKGSSLIGVTKFCDYPPAARGIEKIGGFLDFNMEKLVALAPDIIIAYPEHSERISQLQLKARVVTVRHQRLADLFRSIGDIGRELRCHREAIRLLSSIQGQLNDVSLRVRGQAKKRTMIVAGRNADELKNMYIIGKKDFLNDLLEIAGGVNVYRGNINYPSISLESIIYLKPEFILEISAHYEGIPEEKIDDLWRPYTMIPAVANQQVRIIKDSHWLRPGPRVGRIAEELAGLFSRGGKFK